MQAVWVIFDVKPLAYSKAIVYNGYIKGGGNFTMIFEFRKYKIDVDVDRTRGFYKTHDFASGACTCGGCRNYEKAADYFSEEVRTFFKNLGVDMKKFCEVYTLCTNYDGTVFYGGWYHICGEMISGDAEREYFNITDDFQVSFHKDLCLLEKDFPLPAIQLEISANIPWVLNEINDGP